MNKKWNGRNIFHKCVLVLLVIALGDFLFTGRSSSDGGGGSSFSWKEALAGKAEESVLNVWLPSFAFADRSSTQGSWFLNMLGQQVPLFAYAGSQEDGGLQTESGSTYERILLLEGASEYTESKDGDALEVPETSEGRIQLDDKMTQLLQEENQTGRPEEEESAEQEETPVPSADQFGFIRAAGRSQEYNWSYYQDFDALIKEFYAVDATTQASPARLNLDSLLGKTMAITKNPDVPQILIYHTHSQEDFVDSVPGDSSTTIMGAGELLTQILREEYGYNVIHHTGEYDVEARDYAYSNSLPAIEQVLAENPTIEVVIDLHRDEVLEGRKLVMDLNGKPTAKFMFFNGLSYTIAHGEIEYLQNPYIDDNLAFSFQMQVIANEYYPGLTRRIYLKGYRYNMHLRPRSLLIELGAQTNTVEEIRNACAPIAHILDLELSGKGLY